jgi:hypothetical protein
LDRKMDTRSFTLSRNVIVLEKSITNNNLLRSRVIRLHEVYVHSFAFTVIIFSVNLFGLQNKACRTAPANDDSKKAEQGTFV